MTRPEWLLARTGPFVCFLECMHHDTEHVSLQRLRSMVHEIVGRINGHYGTLTHVPIHHLDRQLAFHELCALYAVTDIALVTSLRDGMNLVSYEYVACQSDNAGEHTCLGEPAASAFLASAFSDFALTTPCLLQPASALGCSRLPQGG